jgi:hypothetical protein
MSAEQHQHYLPQSYQRGWTDASGRVHVYRWRHDRLVCDSKPTRSTGGRAGLYYTPMAPPELRNYMEDVFWRRIDQWGHDGLALMRSKDPAALGKFNLQRMAVFLQALVVRNPRRIAEIERQARRHVLESCLVEDYDRHRRSHEPATLEEFKVALAQPGLTEHGAAALRSIVFNEDVRRKLMAMEWQVVTVSNSVPILTSDAPLIRYKGLAHDDGLMLLPLSSAEFLAIFNRGAIDMVRSIEMNIRDGVFVPAMNKYVVQHKIDYVYAIDDSQMDLVARYWAVSESAHVPLFPG